MDYTTNKNLAKPTENETYDLATVNENMDKIDAALKTNDDAITQLNEKTTITQLNVNNAPVLTTKEWLQADGGFSWSVPTAGWYYLKVGFTKTKDGSDYTGDMQLHIKSEKKGSIAYGFISKLSSMTVSEINTILQLAEGDKIFPNVHTAKAGLKFNTSLYPVLLRKI